MRDYFSLVTFSHTVFALPFALLGFTLAVIQPAYAFAWTDLLLVVACMVFARSSAMGFNRLVDRNIDAANERTATRDIPAGKISPNRAKVFIGINAALFILSAGLLNLLCLALSPVALAVVLGYSYTKRFTWLCHLVLGLGLALAPIGAYVAITGAFDTLPVIYGVIVLLWVAGFDIIYALQDEAFDREQQLNSIPTRFGGSRALRLSRFLHFLCIGLLTYVSLELFQLFPEAQYAIMLSWVVFAGALIYQQSIVSVGDLSRVGRAFFTTNGIASIAYATILIGGILFL
ncbi:MAG: UbiA-like polyprenyltransferase [Saprospiraceae bacterium]